MLQLRRSVLALAAAVGWLLVPASASALAVYDMHIALTGGVPSDPGHFDDYYALYDLPTTYTPSPVGGTYVLDSDPLDPDADPYLDAEGQYSIGWSSVYDTDPFVTNNLNVTNIGALPLTVDVTVTSPVVPQTPNTAIQGSVGITLTNTTGTASASTSAGVAFYTALIDGVPVQTLFPDPNTPVSCGTPFCSDVNTDDFGIPIALVFFPPALSDIGIRIRFVLSPGDTLGVTSVFNVEAATPPVPEPVSLALVGVVIAGAALARRRA